MWDRIAKQVAEAARRERAEAIEELRNAIADIINERQPPVEIVVFVLRSIEAELLLRENREHLTASTWREARAQLEGIRHGVEADSAGQ